MTEQELDVAYTALCRALGEVGPGQAERFLAMLAMGLLVRCERADEVLPLIDSVRESLSPAGRTSSPPAAAGERPSPRTAAR